MSDDAQTPPAPPRRSCQACDFWFGADDGRSTGACRRQSPSPRMVTAVWPVVSPVDWCGEYVSRDLKIATEGQALATLKSLAVVLEGASGELLAAAEAFKAKGGMGSQANRAYAAHLKAREIAGEYLQR